MLNNSDCSKADLPLQKPPHALFDEPNPPFQHSKVFEVPPGLSADVPFKQPPAKEADIDKEYLTELVRG